jgi:SAM-dependent methyltransferase
MKGGSTPILTEIASESGESISLRFPDILREEFPQEFDPAWAATTAVMRMLPAADLQPLSVHSPGLEGFDWSAYLRLSCIRLVRVAAGLRRANLTSGRLLDFGSYFGNFALLGRELGFEVEAADNYSSYGGAFDPFTTLMSDAGVRVLDLKDTTRDLAALDFESFDAVLCMGVIEHIPHTPRPLLTRLNTLLKPGGRLILDTPNLLYLYTREKLAAGKSIFPPIELQFGVEPPFEGHHREYTPSEVRWMIDAIGHVDCETELYNYSIYGLSELTGSEAIRFRKMQADPELRELIMTHSTKPKASEGR